MTTEEAIRYLAPIAKNARLEHYKEALGLALAALRAQQERENPKPLTLDDLRQMDGEPVWVIYSEEAAKTIPWFKPLALWALVEVTQEESIILTNSLYWRTKYVYDGDLEDDDITIYRHKPKEEKTKC